MGREFKLFDWKLNSPIIVASGPFGSNIQSINNLLESGAGAVVTKTIVWEPKGKQKGCMVYRDHLFNKEGYSSMSIGYWEDCLHRLCDKHVIANIFDANPIKLASLAKHVVENGAKMIELGVSCPTFGNDPLCFNDEYFIATCKAVRREVDVPIIAKLLLSTSKEKNRQMVLNAKNNGIDGISISDSIPAVVFDEKHKMSFGGVGGLSGPLLKNLVLKGLNDIIDIPIVKIGIGGIENANDIMEYLKMGACTVQICSILFKKGNNYIRVLLQEFEDCWKNENMELQY